MYTSRAIATSVAVALATVAFQLARPVPTWAEAPAPASALLKAISTEKSPEQRARQFDELSALGADAIPSIAAYLERKRSSKESDRRSVLRAIKADVPDKKGRFRTPGRKEKVNRGDAFNWLEALDKIKSNRPGFGDVASDVAAIRALAATEKSAAAKVILDFAFTDDGLIYRDECGRYLRKMAPYSLPTLIVASKISKKNHSKGRYVRYQLERLDRENPYKAIGQSAGDRSVVIEILAAYGKSKHREAILPLLDHVDHDDPKIRATARKSLLAYVTGPKPPEAPKRKLALTGGRVTDEPQPLWLTYRELADLELRRKHEEVFGEKAKRRQSPEKLARKLFAHYDEARNIAAAKAYDDARALAEAEKWAEATSAFDRILASQPDHPERQAMARAYYEHAHQLVQKQDWTAAGAAFSKAHGLAPDAAFAKDALAGHYTAIGKALEADGKDGSLAYRRAQAIKPNSPDAEPSGLTHAAPAKHRWMLYAGLGGGAGGLIFLILGLAMRRR